MPVPDLLEPCELDEDLIDLLQSAPVPGLGAGPRCPTTAEKVEDLLQHRSLHGTNQEAGLWLLAGELERSHSISQSLGDRDGSYWHGIMHRREGDFSNAKYWFRKVGTHPIDALLANRITLEIQRSASSMATFPAEQLLGTKSFPCALVDFVQLSRANHVEWQEPLQQICWWEWQLLFAHCRRYSNTQPR